MSGDHGLWAYCVARAGDPLPTGDGVERVESGALAALVRRVPLAEYGEEPLRRNLDDLAWLERVARAHEDVLERALAHATIVPLRLCTIFGNEAGVRRMLDAQAAALETALEALAGRQEWAVKLLVDRSALEASAGGDGAPDDAGSGTAYLLRRRQEREARDAAGRLAARLAEDAHARLSGCAVAAVRNAPQNRRLSGHEGDMVLNGAYLVTDAGELRAAVAELERAHRDLGARLELVGPLPPYNFVREAA